MSNNFAKLFRIWRRETPLPVMVSLFLLLILAISTVVRAQESEGEGMWGQNGSHIYNTNPGNIGVGKSNPAHKLDVSGTINGTAFRQGGQLLGMWKREGGSGPEIPIYYNNGSVGIGTENPAASLHIKRGTGLKMILEQFQEGHPVYWEWRFVEANPWSMGINSAGDFRLSRSGTLSTPDLVMNRQTGSLGLGIANPGNYRLAVDGKVWAKELVVEAEWADDVFEADYPLPEIDSLAGYIAQFGHLPRVPSAAEIAEKGVSLGEMQATLLRKIEELTLYVIDLNRENRFLHQSLDALKENLNSN
ncbi:MAG: hypothetical protein KDI06_18755 [Calditrichaeota bacterium]|nr:hypothetical protein [Calditrichota bacterium]HQU71356.1 hypothetical protein [Calditrichia bacterium]